MTTLDQRLAALEKPYDFSPPRSSPASADETGFPNQSATSTPATPAPRADAAGQPDAARNVPIATGAQGRSQTKPPDSQDRPHLLDIDGESDDEAAAASGAHRPPAAHRAPPVQQDSDRPPAAHRAPPVQQDSDRPSAPARRSDNPLIDALPYPSRLTEFDPTPDKVKLYAHNTRLKEDRANIKALNKALAARYPNLCTATSAYPKAARPTIKAVGSDYAVGKQRRDEVKDALAPCWRLLEQTDVALENIASAMGGTKGMAIADLATALEVAITTNKRALLTLEFRMMVLRAEHRAVSAEHAKTLRTGLDRIVSVGAHQDADDLFKLLTDEAVGLVEEKVLFGESSTPGTGPRTRSNQASVKKNNNNNESSTAYFRAARRRKSEPRPSYDEHRSGTMFIRHEPAASAAAAAYSYQQPSAGHELGGARATSGATHHSSSSSSSYSPSAQRGGGRGGRGGRAY